MLLRNIDLNLLVVLDALLTEKHVTRTGLRLHLSQPAISHSLNKLRVLLDDPLLIRQGNEVVLSALAQNLQALKASPRVGKLALQVNQLATFGGIVEPYQHLPTLDDLPGLNGQLNNAPANFSRDADFFNRLQLADGFYIAREGLVADRGHGHFDGGRHIGNGRGLLPAPKGPCGAQ